MKKKVSVGTLILCVAVAVLLTLQVTLLVCKLQEQRSMQAWVARYDAFSPLLEVHDLYRDYFVRQPNTEGLSDALITAYIAAMGDYYGYYQDPTTFSQTISGLEASYSGIGCLCAPDPETGLLRFLLIMPDSPAAQAGLQVGDLLLSVNGQQTVDYTAGMDALLAPKGTALTLQLRRNGSETTCTVTTGEYVEKTVWWEMAQNDAAIGIIRILGFDAKTPDFLAQALRELQASGAKKLVIDVRENPGGLLDGVCEALDLLLPEGPVVYTVRRGEEPKLEYSSDADHTALPIAVLVNGSTASAAELFSCALQDYAKQGKVDATVVGVTTYGKGTMQELVPLSDGSGLALSTAYYNPPYTENYEGKGVVPDVYCEIDPALADRTVWLYTQQQDNQLQQAIALLQSK